jgi:hypothetical protein
MSLALGTRLNVFGQFIAIKGVIPDAVVVVCPLDFIFVAILLLTSRALHDGRFI